MCVSKKYIRNPEFPNIEIGDEVTAVDEKRRNGHHYWEFAEFPPEKGDWPFWWRSECFAILPDQPADEMRELEREGIVNLERV